MIVDHRTYTLKPGQVKPYLELYEREGLPVQSKHLGQPFGWFITEVGNVNQVVHLWRYADLAERDRRRAAMQADPAWQSFVAKAAPFLDTMENKILKPAPFAPLPPA